MLSKLKRLYSSYGRKIGVFRRKQFVQKQEIFIANKISVVVKDEEKAELFKRSHTTTKRALIYKARQTTPRSRKVGRRQNLNNIFLIVVRKRQPLTQSICRLSRRRRCENVCIWRVWEQKEELADGVKPGKPIGMALATLYSFSEFPN